MDNKPKIAVLMTTYNRAEYTEKCIKSLYEGNPDTDFRFVVVDDKSEDDTVKRIGNLPCKIKVLEGTGGLYWTGGMRKAMSYVMMAANQLDYILLVNDDVEFYEGAIKKMIERMDSSNADVIAGSTCEKSGAMTYGGVAMRSKFFAKFDLIMPTAEPVECDTFNCNAVLMKPDAFISAGNLDGKYIHSMADYDYGMHIGRLGFKIVNSAEHVGSCKDNDMTLSWRNPAIKRVERIKLKESPKGLPFKDWFYFVRKNYGILPALYHSMTPYIRILIKK